MTRRIPLLLLPVVIFFTLLFSLNELGGRGLVRNHFLIHEAYPFTRRIAGFFTDLRFKTRGKVAPKHNIIIVDVDGDSLARIGRWPWRRDITAALIQRTFDAGAKAVGLDMVFSETNQQISDELLEFLKQHKLAERAKDFETDFYLREVIKIQKDRLILGWIPEIPCQPAFSKPEECPVLEPEIKSRFQMGIDRFSVQDFHPDGPISIDQTPLLSILNPIVNLKMYNDVSTHLGFFQSDQDPDGVIRRTNLIVLANGKPYPSLALEMAKVVRGAEIHLSTDTKSRVKEIKLKVKPSDTEPNGSEQSIPVSALGLMDINFRGPAYTFTYVSALDVLGTEDTITYQHGGQFVQGSKAEIFKDALAIVGISAVGVYDMRAFPFDANSPGVEGHATILDNILSDDMLRPGGGGTIAVILLLMTIGALAFSYMQTALPAVWGLTTFVATLLLLFLLDQKIFFSRAVHLNTGFLYLEILFVFLFTIAARVVDEERKKRFIRGAFSKYVAPTIVDSILKDPSKLSVGGDRREISIMFSDIRGFTTFSEKMDAKELAHFLNDYLGIMTDIVFDCDGTLDKYIGDAVMAFWGAPLDQKRHAAQSLKAAVLMHEALARNHDRFKKEFGVDVQIGIGVNTGIVSVGNMGSDRIFEYTVIGDQVNLASRLEGLTKTYGVGVLTSRFTLDAVAAAGDSLPPHRVLDFVKVKGKKIAVELIEVRSAPLPEKMETLFQAGRLLYTERKFDEARQKFVEALAISQSELGSTDVPCEVFIERCDLFKKVPPNADWKGSWEMETK